MSRLIIGKLFFANVVTYYGLELCLSKANREAYFVNEVNATGFDVILLSTFWYRDILQLETFLRKTGLKNKKLYEKPIIIAGGLQATATPELMAQMVDYVFIGDGDDYLGKILDDIENNKRPECKYLYTREMESVPEPAECMPEGFTILHNGLKSVQLNRKAKDRIRQSYKKKCSSYYRTEIARGCKYKCPFCFLSGLKSYREVPYEQILKQIEKIPYGSMSNFFAPERTLHSKWPEIQKAFQKKKLRDCASDSRLEHIEQIDSDSVILGIDGLSYKLRKSINKPFTDEFILEKLELFATTGRRVRFGAKVGAYFIADLPGETKEDFDELLNLFRKMEKAEWSRNLTFVFCLNPLSPKPFTKLYNSPIHLFRNYPAMWTKIQRGGTGEKRWGFRIKEYETWGCLKRTLDLIVHKGKKRGYEVIKSLNNKLLKVTPKEWETQEEVAKEILKKCHEIGLTQEVLQYQ